LIDYDSPYPKMVTSNIFDEVIAIIYEGYVDKSSKNVTHIEDKSWNCQTMHVLSSESIAGLET